MQQKCEFSKGDKNEVVWSENVRSLPSVSNDLGVSLCVCIYIGVCGSNRGVWWGLLTDVAIIGMGSQDVSEPLTCPLALSSPLSPHIDHPTTHHWSGKPGRSTLLRHTQTGVAVCVCVRRKTGWSCVFNFPECSSTGLWVWVDTPISVIRNRNACYIIRPIIQMYSTFPPVCRDVINNVHSSISHAGIS